MLIRVYDKKIVNNDRYKDMRFVSVTVVYERKRRCRDCQGKISWHEDNNYLNLIGHIYEQCTVGRSCHVCMYVNKNDRILFMEIRDFLRPPLWQFLQMVNVIVDEFKSPL